MSRDAAASAFGETELWFADLAGFASLLSTNADISALADTERERAAKMSAAASREDFMLSRILLRRVLAVRMGVAPRDLLFDVNEHGKPTVAGLQFNLSHCRGAWLLGISRHAAIGVDIERPRQIVDIERLATRVFSGNEREQLAAAAASPPMHTATFLRGWTRKEAVLKAMGSGFSSSARDLEVSTQAVSQRVKLPHGFTDDANVWSIDPPIEGFAALALIGHQSQSTSPAILRWLQP